jgi:uncharacterized protein
MGTLHSLVRANRFREVEQLLKMFPNKASAQDRAGRYPLHCLKWGRSHKMLRLLIANASPANVTDRSGETPLHTALWEFATVRECELLCSSSKRLVNFPDRDGNSPILMASVHNSIAIIDCLLRNGARVHARNIVGNTPLMLSTIRHISITKAILAYGAKPNVQNHYGSTALHFAATVGTLTTVRTLLDIGANPQLVDKNGRAAIDYARLHGRSRIVRLLQS